ncbi:OmpA family protein [Caulobacter sp. SLTY]|uniref:OmpA family protein n=1 Tax=Caulobacter sp. SLTY TaxID=2683262 RepID=UPI001F113E71|nr:OmpA family protein [Caulobacter sp. SLTY]
MKTRILMVMLAGAALAACASTNTPKTQVARFTPCEDINVAIYFDSGSAAVSRDGRAVLRGAAKQAEGCKVNGVDVIGLADAVGAPDANLALSEKRAASVTKTLQSYGLTNVRVAAAGDAGAVIPTGSQTTVAAPMRRRADVILRLSANP